MVLSVCGNNFRILSCDFMVGLESVFQQSGVSLFAKKKTRIDALSDVFQMSEEFMIKVITKNRLNSIGSKLNCSFGKNITLRLHMVLGKSSHYGDTTLSLGSVTPWMYGRGDGKIICRALVSRSMLREEGTGFRQ